MSTIPVAETKSNTNWQHLRDELDLLNAHLLREVRLRTKNRQQGQLDQLQGLVLSEHEIVSILTDDVGSPSEHDEESLEDKLREVGIGAPHTRDESNLRSSSQLAQLTELFQLDREEERCVILCLASEVDPNYSRVFAFLQDDVSKKQPSIDLALRLLFKDLPQRVANRSIFSPTSSLLKNRILQLSDASGRHMSFPQVTLKLDDRIVAFLLQTPQLDESLLDWVDYVAPMVETFPTNVPNEIREQTLSLVERCFLGGKAPLRPVIHLYGKRGSGRRALAILASQRIGLPLLVADLTRFPPGIDGVEALWRLCRESLLLPAVVLVEGFDELLLESRGRELTSFLRANADFSPLTFLSGTQRWLSDKPRQHFLSLECQVPNSTARMHYWRECLRATGYEVDDGDLVELSSKFSFTEGQIRQTVETTRFRAFWEDPSAPKLTASLLSNVGRSVATPNLGELARKIEPCHVWSDLVLPEAQVLQLREIVAHVKRAQMVFEQWGFAQNYSYGKGLAALFEGLSGTGKTMAAGILGGALGLDLYKIDLSSVVSKYIGETEKNLNRIFSEAQDSNAILFFDEADAVFAKRSEVKDAHDRYANLETAYLLQRMEEYSGIVILASNMKQNMDEAFVRRMRFIIHFPFPAEEDRARIWQKVFPEKAPLGDVDFHWLAKHLKISGGNIKNISLRAAFMAIERHGKIDMDCLIEAAQREMDKIGKISALAEFRVRPPHAETIQVAEVA
jgi:hypothetical protein